MKISTKGRYALESLLAMGVLVGNEPVAITRIIEETHISKNYLEQIFFQLRKAGVLSSKRGPKGGYYIAIPLNELTANQIITAVEGEIIPVPCSKNPDVCTCNINDKCSTTILWQELYQTINRNLVEKTLQDMVDDYKDKMGA